MKTCSKCRRERPLSDFVNDPHETGVVRALLCGLCNAGIGRLRDDPAICISAAMYLFEHEGVLV